MSIQMNIHRIILAVLAAATIAVGTTTVAVYADGPSDLVPEEVLTGADLENWNALTAEFKAVILYDFIPEIPERAPDPSHHVTTLASLVAMMLDIQEKMEERGAGSGQAPGVAGAAGASRVRCESSVLIDTVGALSSLYCRATMANISAYVQVGRRDADTLAGRANETCWDCSREWARVYDPPPNPCYRRHATGSATPTGYEPNGPYPAHHTYSGEHDTYC